MKNQKTYIIAEAGVNHNGDINLAHALIDVAVDSGADAVKFQTFFADKLVTTSAKKADYQVNNTKNSESQYAMLKKLELSCDSHGVLKKYCDQKNIHFLSTPFDLESADFLINKLNMSTIKIASGEITNAPLLLSIAKSNVNIILSTGMSILGEIEDALSVIAFGFLNGNEIPTKKSRMHAYFSEEGQKILQEKVTLLHCTSDYPAKYSDIHLKAMDTLSSGFNLRIGYSDHTLGIAVPIAAVARGACVIEKHFTLDKMLPGPDHSASLTPVELKEMVQAIRHVEMALGNSKKQLNNAEMNTQSVARKSLIANSAIQCGEKFSPENLCVKRPGNGISPMNYWDYLNKDANHDYAMDDLIHD